jgi:uncharacterized protein (TIGR02996 family)
VDFLAAIRSAPDDDTPRRVYADWLVERGDPLGELIQVQCDLARERSRARRVDLRVHEAELLDLPAAASWFQAAIDANVEIGFVRGFPERVRASAITVDALAKVFATFPLADDLELDLRYVRYDDVAEEMFEDVKLVEHVVQLAADPLFGRIRTLRLVRGSGFPEAAGDTIARAIAASPHAGRLERVVTDCMTGAGTRVLLEALPGLRELDAPVLPVDDLRELGQLRLRALRVRLPGASLDEVPALESLEELAVVAGDASGPAIVRLVERLPALRRLDLSDNFVLDDGARAIAVCPLAARLEELDLHRTGLGAAGVAALARSPHLERLAAIDLGKSTLRTDGARALAGSPLLARIESLGLGGSLLSDDEAAPIRGAGRLVELDLHNNSLTAAGAEHVARWGMGALRSIDLETSPHLQNAGLAILGRALPTVTIVRSEHIDLPGLFPKARRFVRPVPRQVRGRLGNGDTLS